MLLSKILSWINLSIIQLFNIPSRLELYLLFYAYIIIELLFSLEISLLVRRYLAYSTLLKILYTYNYDLLLIVYYYR